MKLFRPFAAALGVAALALIGLVVHADAQSFPQSSPFYIPQGQTLPGSLTAPGTVVFTNQNWGSLVVEVTGTGASFSAEVDVTAETAASPTLWVQTAVQQSGAAPNGGVFTNLITGNGIYRLDLAGIKQARFKLNSIGSGTVTVNMSGTSGPRTAALSNVDMGPVITNAAQVPGTVNSSAFLNELQRGLECTFVATSEVGSPSTTFAIQEEDEASGTWTTLLASAALTTSTVNTSKLEVYPGIQTTSLPSSSVTFAAISLHVPKIFRVTETVTGGTSLTGTVGCNLLN